MNKETSPKRKIDTIDICEFGREKLDFIKITCMDCKKIGCNNCVKPLANARCRGCWLKWRGYV